LGQGATGEWFGQATPTSLIQYAMTIHCQAKRGFSEFNLSMKWYFFNRTGYTQTSVVASGNLLQFAIEACHRNSGFTHLSMVDLSIVMLNYQRVAC